MESLRTLRDEVTSKPIRAKIAVDRLLLKQREGFLTLNTVLPGVVTQLLHSTIIAHYNGLIGSFTARKHLNFLCCHSISILGIVAYIEHTVPISTAQHPIFQDSEINLYKRRETWYTASSSILSQAAAASAAHGMG